jgi:Papain family cysteine protease
MNDVPASDVDLSEQQLIDCLPGKCNGGWTIEGLEYIALKGGMANEISYPYAGKAKTCKASTDRVCKTCLLPF